MAVVPMFPLGSVLVPGAVLPLHVFEERYRQLVRDCVEAEDHEFGVVLIDRGHEVGGGDVRRDVGTMARMVQVAELPDGRFAVVAVGVRRVRVTHWLPDDPYPRADVEDWNDLDEWIDPDQLAAITQRARRTAAAAAELGDPTVEATSPLHDDAALAVHQLAGLAPLGAADVYDLLCQPGPRARLQLLDRMLADVEAAQAFRLQSP
jgi:Lon protease-like protein